MISNFKFQISNFFLCIILLFLLFSGNFASASTTDGTVTGHAWSDEIGWVNFETTTGNVHVTDSVITGWAWNENKGRVNLNPTNGGVSNNGEGTLSGTAWNEGTGWINFSGVIINSSGLFTGTATGDNGADIYFSCSNCNVTTDWRPQSNRCGDGSCLGTESCSSCPSDCGICNVGGEGGGGTPSSPRPPFSILINNGSQYTNNQVVKLSLNGGPDAYDMEISNSPDFLNSVKERYQDIRMWTMADGDGQKSVHVKFFTRYNAPSDAVSDSIILDTISPEIKITSVKDKYTTDEEVFVEGATEKNAYVSMILDDSYGAFQADENGKWFINLGKLNEGAHHLEFTVKDLAGNEGPMAPADFSVVKNKNILRKLEEALKPLIDKIFKPPQQVVITVPKAAQVAFKVKWRLLPEPPIERYIMAPLPEDVKFLAQRFPQLNKTFSEVGIGKITDVQKIRGSNIILPGLTEATSLKPADVSIGKIALVKGVPIASLSAIAKSKIPSNIVFSKAGGGLVDFNIALSINDKGGAEQRITTLVNSSLQLVVRPEGQVKKVRGYIVFKSKKPKESSYNFPMNYLTASLVVSNPQFLSPAESDIEERLVVSEFDYVDAGNGVYTAEINTPVVDGEYEVITVVEYEDQKILPKEIKLTTVIDPEGYIYEKDGDKETRIIGAIVSLYWLNPDTDQYELWPARSFQQENPQTTNVSGTYSFLVPDGYYYLRVDTPGYLSYDGKPFQVTQGGGIHINIELKTRYWFLRIFDWKTLLLIIVGLMLLYNFYKDRARER